MTGALAPGGSADEREHGPRSGRKALDVIPFFVGYAFVVWMLAYRWRREPSGYLAAAGGLAGLLGIAWLHYRLSIWTDGAVYLPMLQTLLYPYTALVSVVAFVLASVVRPFRAGGGRFCGYCRHDLVGLPDTQPVCPECGAPRSFEDHAQRESVRESQLRRWAPREKGASAHDATRRTDATRLHL
ncbi:MAG TPA: hypothetical protein PLU35_12960 [Phycisphaerales bacterium]|nr:hypothetical protein [Phycisphaerales bacterium]